MQMSGSEILQPCILGITLQWTNFIIFTSFFHCIYSLYMASRNQIMLIRLKESDYIYFLSRQDHGGELTSKVGGPHTLRLLPTGEKSFSVSSDVFSAQYVYDCVKEKRLLDPSKYRSVFCCFDFSLYFTMVLGLLLLLLLRWW